MIPDYQTLMLPVLQAARGGERKIGDVVEEVSQAFGLSEEERATLLPSGKQAVIANRVHWARTYLKQAGLLSSPRRGHFRLTERGLKVLSAPPERITVQWLEQFPEFRAFRSRSRETHDQPVALPAITEETPEEALRGAHRKLEAALASDILDKLREAEPAFFEAVIIELLAAMGYGASNDAGEVVGRSGDDGVDGVINQDPLGVDQVYVQAKRYAEGSSVGAGAIREFYGALGLKDVTKGIFVTTSTFSAGARSTAEKLGARIVLIDGARLADLMIEHEIGCRVTEVFRVATLEESYFE